MSRLISYVGIALVAFGALAADEKAKEEPATAPASVLDFTVKDIDGKETKLAEIQCWDGQSRPAELGSA